MGGEEHPELLRELLKLSCLREQKGVLLEGFKQQHNCGVKGVMSDLNSHANANVHANANAHDNANANANANVHANANAHENANANANANVHANANTHDNANANANAATPLPHVPVAFTQTHIDPD